MVQLVTREGNRVKPKVTGFVLRRWLATGLKVGLVWTVLDFFVFFAVPEIREPTRELLGRAMEPVLLALPAAVAGLSLLGWMLSLLWRDGSDRR